MKSEEQNWVSERWWRVRRDAQNKGNSRDSWLGHCKDTEKTGLEVGLRRSHGPQSLADHMLDCAGPSRATRKSEWGDTVATMPAEVKLMVDKKL